MSWAVSGSVKVSQLVARLAGVINTPSLLPSDGNRVVQGVRLFEPDMNIDYANQLVLSTRTNRLGEEDLAKMVGAAMVVMDANTPLPPNAVALSDGPVFAYRSPWLSRSELFVTLSEMLDAQGRAAVDSGHSETLQDLAQWTADRSQTSITIEDLESRVLAFSIHGGDVDPIRSDTILGRAVPTHRVRELIASGFLPTVWNSTDVVEREADGDSPARTVISVRSRGAAIATIWSDSRGSVDREEVRSVLRTASLAAVPIILEQRNRSRLEERASNGSFRALLEGRTGVTADEAGLLTGSRYGVLAAHSDRGTLDDLRFHLRAKFPAAVSGLLGKSLYAAIPIDQEEESDGSRIRAFLERSLANRALKVGIGSPSDANRIKISADEAKYALLLLIIRNETEREPSDLLQVGVASVDQHALGLLAAANQLTGLHSQLLQPLRTIREAESSEKRTLEGALAAYLRSSGNVAAAARDLGIHGNSLRQRLARIESLLSLRLSNQNDRLSLELSVFLDQYTSALSLIE